MSKRNVIYRCTECHRSHEDCACEEPTLMAPYFVGKSGSGKIEQDNIYSRRGASEGVEEGAE